MVVTIIIAIIIIIIITFLMMTPRLSRVCLSGAHRAAGEAGADGEQGGRTQSHSLGKRRQSSVIVGVGNCRRRCLPVSLGSDVPCGLAFMPGIVV
jgi:hypothetical protein